MDAAIQRWKLENDNQNPTVAQFDTIRNAWQTKDKVAKFIGMHSSRRCYSDWKAAEPDENTRNASTWDTFVTKMKTYYKPTENTTLKNFHFRALCQDSKENFMAFCNRVDKEAKHCGFKCDNDGCTAEQIAVRDQIIIGISNEKIREEALQKSWDLASLRTNGMKLDSAMRSASEIGGEGNEVNKLGKYSYKNMKDKQGSAAQKPVTCWFCGQEVSTGIKNHLSRCPGKKARCLGCGKLGHFAKVLGSNEEGLKEAGK